MNRKNTLGLVRNAPFRHSASDPSESCSAGLQIFRKVIPWELLLKICRLNYRSEIKLPGLLRNSAFRNSASDPSESRSAEPQNLRAEWFVNLSESGLWNKMSTWHCVGVWVYTTHFWRPQEIFSVLLDVEGFISFRGDLAVGGRDESL